MHRKIQLSILSDSRLFRDTVAARLAREAEIEVVSQAGTVHDLLTRAQARPIEVLLVHLTVASAVAAEIVWDVKALLPAARVIVLGFEDAGEDVLRWIEAGVLAFLDHGATYSSLVETIRAVTEGRTTCSLEVLAQVVQRIEELSAASREAIAAPRESLSERETEVARLLALGLVNKQIARRLGVKQPTVKSHVHNILKKLGTTKRRDVIYRLRQGGMFFEES